MQFKRLKSFQFYLVLVLCSTLVFAVENSNSSRLINETSSRQPPAKSLFNQFNSVPFLENNQNILKSSSPFPDRESYIAFEHAHPSNEQDVDQYFKPSKFPGVYNAQQFLGMQMQNPLAQSPQYFLPPQQYPPPPQYPQQPQYHPPPPPPPLLRLVKIPGELKIEVGTNGRNDLIVTCEYPPYLLIIQQIYWHVIPPPQSLLVPYGTFYDSRNGFAPRVTVTSISKWKSILHVRDFTADDYGSYRCVSTAILPDEPGPAYSPPPPPPPPHSYLLHFPHESLELRSSESSLSSTEIKPKSKIRFRSKREIGAFGVFAPFFKPQYGIYRVYKEVKFYGGGVGDIYGSSSELIENTISKPGVDDELGKDIKANSVRSKRRFDMVSRRRSKVLF